jgi:hypothetical protein
MNLLDAMADPTVFGAHFPGPSWDNWKALVAGLFALPMTPAQRATFSACTRRETPPTRPATECWVIAGRRSGKSRTAAVVAAYLAALAKVDHLAPGEYGVVLLCAVDKQQAKVLFDYVKALFEVPALRALVVGETGESLELGHGVRVEVRSSNYRRVRGVTLIAAIIDEVAFLRDEASALPDVELVRALKPALATTGGPLIGISSPWAQRGVLWAKYRRHFGHDGDVLVWQSDTARMNPTLAEAVIADALEDDPEAAASEWLGQFRSDLESYVSIQVLDAVTTPGVTERPPVPRTRYVGFVDVAAGSGRDSYAIAIAHCETRPDEQPFVVVDAVREIAPPFDPLAVTAEVAAVLTAYRVEATHADAFAGAWVTETFQRHGVHVVQDAEPKSSIYLSALPLFTGRRCDVLDIPKLRAQLAGLERRRRAGGRDVVDHSPGAHDDLANACCGALATAAAGATAHVAPLASNLAPERRTRILERDGGGHADWLFRSGI